MAKFVNFWLDFIVILPQKHENFESFLQIVLNNTCAVISRNLYIANIHTMQCIVSTKIIFKKVLVAYWPIFWNNRGSSLS